MYFYMLEFVFFVVVFVMIRDFSEMIELLDDEEEVVGFMIYVEEKEYIVFFEFFVLEEGFINVVVDVKQLEVVIFEEEEYLLEFGVVVLVFMVKEVVDVLKIVEGDKLLVFVYEKEFDNVVV